MKPTKEITVNTCTTPTNPFNYNTLMNKPKINGVELKGDLTTEDLNIKLEDLQDSPVIGDGTLTLLNNKGEVVGKFSANSQENVAINIGSTLKDAVEDVIVDGESVVSNGVAVIDLKDKQDKLVSGENIKTINGKSILGDGNFSLVTKNEYKEDKSDLEARLDLKADEINLLQHVQDSGSHVLPADRSRWNNKQDALISGENIKTINGQSILGSGNLSISGGTGGASTFADITGDPYENAALSQALNAKANNTDLANHINDADVHVTDLEKETWNNKLDEADLSKYATKDDLATKADVNDVYSKLDTYNKTEVYNKAETELQITTKGYQTGTQVSEAITNSLKNYVDKSTLSSELVKKQDALLSGTNIKTLNGQSLLGEGNIEIEGGTTPSFADITGNPLDNEALKSELETKAEKDALANYATKQEVSTKANSADVYLKTEVYNKAETTNEVHRVAYDRAEVDHLLDDLSAKKQDTLVSGGNIKTINGESLLGSGNINIESFAEVSFADIKGNATDNVSLATALNEKLDEEELEEALVTKQDTLVSGTNIKTINDTSLLGEGNLVLGTLSAEDAEPGDVIPINADLLGGHPVEDFVLVNNLTLKTINGQSIIGQGDITVGDITSEDGEVTNRAKVVTLEEITNGNIIKYDNGLCIQIGTFTESNLKWEQIGALFEAKLNNEIELEVPLLNEYSISFNNKTSTSMFVTSSYQEADKIKNIKICSPVNTAEAITIAWTAIGRWK